MRTDITPEKIDAAIEVLQAVVECIPARQIPDDRLICEVQAKFTLMRSVTALAFISQEIRQGSTPADAAQKTAMGLFREVASEAEIEDTLYPAEEDPMGDAQIESDALAKAGHRKQ